MDHDLVAELKGYRNERAIHTVAGNAEHADHVAAEIDRVSALVSARAETLDAAAAAHMERGADVRAAHARTEARRLRAALDTPPAAQTTAESKPQQTATTRRGGRARKQEDN